VFLLVLLLTMVVGVLPAFALTKVLAAPASPAVVAAPVPGTSWGGFEVGSTCLLPGYKACLQIEVEGRVLSTSTAYDSTSGWARVTADDSGRIASVQVARIALANQFGVLTMSGPAASTSRPAVAALEGPAHAWGRFCSTRYLVIVDWSARLTDGSVRTGTLFGRWYSAPTC
jgi:hypothetical protein